jgi:hypothetical protein
MDVIEATSEYLEGRQARDRNEAAKVCPYPSMGGRNTMRTRWMCGFWDRHTRLLEERIDQMSRRHERMQDVSATK